MTSIRLKQQLGIIDISIPSKNIQNRPSKFEFVYNTLHLAAVVYYLARK